MLFPNAVQHDPAVKDWLREHSGELGAIAQHWFSVMRACGGDVKELLHDGPQPPVWEKRLFATSTSLRLM